ncbi:MAG: Hsp20/alpha crystallin family protein [Acidilobaceae archaeon]
MSYDPFEELRRRIYKAIRDTMRSFEREFEEMESLMEEMLAEAREWERMFEEKVEEIRGGYVEPLTTMIDRGDKILLIVETPGARQETVEVIVTERAIRVEAKLDEERVRRALGGVAHARRLTTMRGEYRLPYPVDPAQVRVERRGSKVYIWIPKLQPT